MAVAFDNWSTGVVVNDVNLAWVHVPTGTPAGVIIVAQLPLAGADVFSTVSYGGIVLPRIGQFVGKTSGEAMCTAIYGLTSGIPTGNQAAFISTVSTSIIVGYAITVTAARDTQISGCDFSINNDSIANPTSTVAVGARSSFSCIGIISGQDASANVTPSAGWTSRFKGNYGATTSALFTNDTVGTSDVTAGWTQTADDAVAISIAISEVFWQGSEIYGLSNPYSFHYGDERSWETSNNILVASPSPGIIPGMPAKTIQVGGHTAVDEDYERILNPVFYGAKRFRPIIGTIPLPPSVGGIFPVKRIGVGIGVK